MYPLANVIWPTFITPYVIGFNPIVGGWIFLSEIITALLLWRKASKGKIAFAVLLANITSSGMGIIFCLFMSQIPGELNNLNSTHATRYLFLVFCLLFTLSVTIEMPILKRFLHQTVWLKTIVLNVVSYAGIMAIWLFAY
jgi:hypothetical protein